MKFLRQAMDRPRSALSREGRDTLWLLGVLALSIYPHAGHMPWWCIGGVTVALLWRAQIALHDGKLPPRWVLMLALVAAIGLTVLTFKSIFGREAGVTLVSVLAGLKTLELRARRDAFVITSLGFFLILTQFLFSQSILTALMMTGVFWGLLTSLVLAQRPLYRPTIWSAAQTAGKTMLFGVPTMLVLYLLFPRIGPLWTAPGDAQAGIGLSDQLTLGHVAELAMDDSIAMRLKFDGPPPPANMLYFRGPVLERFDGKSWQSNRDARPKYNTTATPTPSEAIRPAGPSLTYQMTLEPNKLREVPILEGTVVLHALGTGSTIQLEQTGISWVADKPLSDRTQWQGTAWLATQSGPQNFTPELQALLELPARRNPKTLTWARQFQAAQGAHQLSPSHLAAAVMQHIRSQDYVYTLAPGDTGLDATGQPDPHLIDRFWMDRRTGFCEHFATAFVVVMRAMGVPARVITGYQGMERNPVDGLYVVRNNHAHAWAEYWQAEVGWVRADPTAAVSPDRIQNNRPLTRPRQGLAAALPQMDTPWLKQARAFLEASNHRWNIWVLEYSRSKQMELLSQLGWDSPDWMSLIRLGASLMAILSGLGIVWLWWTRPRTKVTHWHRQLTRIHRGLTRLGLTPPTGSASPAPALVWASHLSAQTWTPVEAPYVAQLCQRLQKLDALRYGAPDKEADLKKRSHAEVAEIEQLCRKWHEIRRAR